MNYSTLKKLHRVFEDEKRIAVCEYTDDGYHWIDTVDEETEFEHIDRLVDNTKTVFFVLEGNHINYNEEIVLI